MDYIRFILIVHTYEWKSFHKCFTDSVDLRTKRRVFDGVMAERRLREEKKILVLEMNRHWRSLTLRGDSLKELICSTTMPGIILDFTSHECTHQWLMKKVTNAGLVLCSRFTVGFDCGRNERSAEHRQTEAASCPGNDGFGETMLPQSFDWSGERPSNLFRCVFRQWLWLWPWGSGVNRKWKWLWCCVQY